MPGQHIDRPNPDPMPSHLPDSLEDLQVKLERIKLDQRSSDALAKFRRAACYIAAGEILRGYDPAWISETDRFTAMIFLKDNTLLKRAIEPNDIKPRLLGEH